MESLLKDNFVIFLLLVVPGFVAIKVFDLLVPTERRDFSKSIVEVASFGAINLALVQPLLRYIDPEHHPVAQYFVVLMIVVVVPALLAVGWRRLLTAEILKGKVIHPVPAAWDYYFLQARECWVLCHLKSGSKVGGWFGSRSFASGFPQGQELYIEKLWKVGADGVFQEEVQRSQGAFVRREDCHAIEFFTTE